MSIRSLVIGGLTLLLFLGLSPGLVLAQDAAQAEPQISCGDCHDQAKAFRSNPHARGQVKGGQVPNDVCSTCHGDGTAHIEAGGDPTKIEVPRGVAGANNTCLMCHDASTDRRSHRTGMHANSAAVNCFSCHKVHSNEVKLLAAPQNTVCSSCHGTQVAEFRNKPHTHRLGRGGMECSSCHEPHGRPGRESIRTTAAGEPACASCHSDKRGPFVFNHGGMAAGSGTSGSDCTNCHEAHGSTNPAQLKRATIWQLCLECHSPIEGNTLGSQPPSFHNLSNPRYRNCTTCHVAIHGSNRSPQLLK
jgi:DmsE family decaheme c-type cytochrome